MSKGIAFQQVSPWYVEDNVRAGKTVYMLDRQTHKVEDFSNTPYGKAVEVINNEYDQERGRYSFWIEEEEEPKAEETETEDA